MKSLSLLLMLLAFVSCGKKSKVKICKTRSDKIYQCIKIQEPAYGWYYARSMCENRYFEEKCY